MTVQELIQRFGGVPKRNGSYMSVACPTLKHSDRQNNRLLIAESTKQSGRTYLKCLDNCSVEEIMQASGLTYRDLFHAVTPGIAPVMEPDPILMRSATPGSKNTPDEEQIVTRIQNDTDYILEWGTRDSRNKLMIYLRAQVAGEDAKE